MESNNWYSTLQFWCNSSFVSFIPQSSTNFTKTIKITQNKARVKTFKLEKRRYQEDRSAITSMEPYHLSLCGIGAKCREE